MTKQKQAFLSIITPLFKGIGQIMLQNNSWTGLFFLAGICCGSLMMGACGRNSRNYRNLYRDAAKVSSR
jgi:urea transporter